MEDLVPAPLGAHSTVGRATNRGMDKKRAIAVELELQSRRDLLARKEAAERIAEQREELTAGAGRAKAAFTSALDVGRERLEDFTKVETTGLYSRVQEAVAERSVPVWEPPDWIVPSEDEDFITMPPLVNLIQGAFAPARIHALRDNANWVFYVDFVFLTLSVVIFIIDYQKHCEDIEVWIWQVGFLTITALDWFSRIFVVRWCNEALDGLQHSREELDKANAAATGNSLFDSFAKIRRGSQSYFEAYFKMMAIQDSPVLGFVRFLEIFNLLWGGFGLWVSIHDIVIDSLACSARLALTWMHIYSFFYVMLLTWNLFWLVYSVIGLIATSDLVSTPIIRAAKKFDDNTMKGFPVALTLIESFVLKNSSSSISMGAMKARQDLAELGKRIHEMEEKLHEKQRQSELIHQLDAESRTEQEFMERINRKLTVGLDQAKPLVGLIAANVRTNDVSEEVPKSAHGSRRSSGVNSVKRYSGGSSPSRRGSTNPFAADVSLAQGVLPAVEESSQSIVDQVEDPGSDVEAY